MRRRVRNCALIAVAAALLITLALKTSAQSPARDPNGQSLADAIEAIRHARVATRVLFITAHPDDESSGLLTYLARGAGDEVALLTVTRGQGGQNAIGPEQGDQLGVIRSAELLAATQTYGTKLFFTRAPDFGFSKTLEETLKMWDDVAMDDMVRVIRTFKPEVVINGWGGVRTGHGNHQAAGYLTPKAVEAAADPNAYTQNKDALKPWKVDLLVQQGRGQNAAGISIPVAEVSPEWGDTYVEIARLGFVNQRSQGVVAASNAPFRRGPVSLQTAQGGTFDRAQLSEPLTWLARRFPAETGIMEPALTEADQALERARVATLALDYVRSANELAHAGTVIAVLQEKVKSAGGASAADADYELAQVRAHIDRALTIATAVQVTARADRGNLVAGESFTVRTEFQHRQGFDDTLFEAPALNLPPGWQAAAQASTQGGGSSMRVTVPANAETGYQASEDEGLLPFRLPLVTARVHATINGYGFDTIAEVVSQQATEVSVITETLRFVPPVSLTLEPKQFVLAEDHGGQQTMDLLVRAHSYSTADAHASFGLDVPQGWQVSGAQESDVKAGGDSLLRFKVTPPAKAPAGNYDLKAWARIGARQYRTSLEPLPSLPSYLWSSPSDAPVHAFPISVPANLRVGYIAADIDPVPAALQRVGIQVDMLDPSALAFGDLHKYDAIIVGIRAYELRSDVLPNNGRLKDYISAGGTLVVEYQRIWDTLSSSPAPYPSRMEGTLRITDENSPVRFTDPNSPLLNFPNKITQADFNGWVQERANYMWSSWDSHYQTVLAMNDPGEQEQLGSLVWSRSGKGVFIYTGIEFFRQLPEGNAGAYRLIVNLLSQSRAK
ncbi:MAG TPA: PIG-L family deacetylase [Candidatus Acidoferrales bacterium]|nr:PIG-L family deacetylase [Candidatus Acidoferrales bacterium]